jgi:hypothetical protein
MAPKGQAWRIGSFGSSMHGVLSGNEILWIRSCDCCRQSLHRTVCWHPTEQLSPRQNTPSHMDVLAHGLLSEKSSSRRSFVFGAIAPCSGGDAALFWRGAGATTTEASRRSSTSRGTLPLIRSICGVLCRHGSFSLLIFFVVLI